MSASSSSLSPAAPRAVTCMCLAAATRTVACSRVGARAARAARGERRRLLRTPVRRHDAAVALASGRLRGAPAQGGLRMGGWQPRRGGRRGAEAPEGAAFRAGGGNEDCELTTTTKRRALRSSLAARDSQTARTGARTRGPRMLCLISATAALRAPLLMRPCPRASAPQANFFAQFLPPPPPNPADVFDPNPTCRSPGLPNSYDEVHAAAIEGVSAALSSSLPAFEVDFPPLAS
eukprot:6881377-Prymnesium_polylepis.1